MDKFLATLGGIFFVLLWFVIVLSYIGGVGEMQRGGGGLAGGALVAAAILIAAARMRKGRTPPTK